MRNGVIPHNNIRIFHQPFRNLGMSVQTDSYGRLFPDDSLDHFDQLTLRVITVLRKHCPMQIQEHRVHALRLRNLCSPLFKLLHQMCKCLRRDRPACAGILCCHRTRRLHIVFSQHIQKGAFPFSLSRQFFLYLFSIQKVSMSEFIQINCFSAKGIYLMAHRTNDHTHNASSILFHYFAFLI